MLQKMKFYGKNFTIKTVTMTTTGLSSNKTTSINAMSGKILYKPKIHNHVLVVNVHISAIAFYCIAFKRISDLCLYV